MGEEFEDRLRAGLRQHAARVGGAAEPPLADVRRRARRRVRVQRTVTGLTGVAVLGMAGLALGPLLLAERDAEVVLEPGPDEVEEQAEPPTAEDEPADLPALTRSCSGSDQGIDYTVRYPEDWWANDGTVAEPCRFFHPEPLEAEPGTDGTEFAIMVGVADASLADVAEPAFAEVREEDEARIDGRTALVQELEQTEATLYPEDTVTYRYLLEVGERTLQAVATDASAHDDFAETREVLDAMAETLRVDDVSEAPAPEDGAPEPEVIFDVEPACAEVGDGFTAIASGLEPGEEYSVVIDPRHSDAAEPGTFGEADEDGRLEISATLPEDTGVRPGDYTLTLSPHMQEGLLAETELTISEDCPE